VAEFNRFILDFYDGDNRRVAENFIRFGVPIQANTPYWDSLKNMTDGWWPADLRDNHHMITDMELFSSFMGKNNYPLLYCRPNGVTGCFRLRWRQSKRVEPLYTDERVSDLYASRALNMDLIRPGNSQGCRMFGSAEQPTVSGPEEERKIRTDDFLSVFSLRREATSFAPAVDNVYLNSSRVAYIHFNGHCKPHMCQEWMCENVHRWAKGQPSYPDLSPLKYCCGDGILSP